jgi:hypothetical protein
MGYKTWIRISLTLSSRPVYKAIRLYERNKRTLSIVRRERREEVELFSLLLGRECLS